MMKSINCIRGLFILVFLISISLSSVCQTLASSDLNYSGIDNSEVVAKRKNKLKLNLYSLLMKNYSLSYERTIGRKTSIQIGYRFQPYSYLGETFLGRQMAKKNIGNIEYFTFQNSNNAVTLDFRKYFGRKSGAHGFYVSGYGRYSRFDIDNTDYLFINEKGDTYHVPIVSNINGIGGGLSVGWQLLIKKRICIDISFTGGHYGNLSGTLESIKDLSGLSESERSELREQLQDLYSINERQYLQASITDKGINGKISGPFFGFRSGLCVGFIF